MWSDGRGAFGRRLFQLLPEDKFDRGPVTGTRGRVLVADVRLDNRAELIAGLGCEPEIARSLSDAGVLMAALDRWDIEAVDRLRGDFAFALWDGGEQRLLLARDYLGQKPLHLHRHADFVAFASMPKGLHALPDVPRAPDRDHLTRFLALMPETGSASFFEGIERVEPGHVQIITPTKISSLRYWHPNRTELRLKRDEDYVDAVRAALDRAVASRLRGTSERVGAQMSGGLDSTAVAATAARLIGEDGRVAAFTAVPGEGFDGPVPRGRFGDEGPLAASVAAMYPNIEHLLIRTHGRSPVAALDRNFFLFERPVLNLCNGVWNDAILDAAKQRKLSVMLTGNAGNMGFSYAGFEQLPDWLRSGRLISLARHILKLRKNGVPLESSIAQSVGPYLPRSLWLAISRWRGRDTDLSDISVVNGRAATAMRAAAGESGLDFSYRPRRDPFGTRLFALGRVDAGNYNKGFLGGWGIDTRDPTADRDLVELCLSIPPPQFLKGGIPRSLARRVAADRLPSQIIEEKRKGLQAIDWYEGMRAAREDVLGEVQRITNVRGAAEIIEPAKLANLTASWPADGWASDKVTKGYRLALLRGVSGGHFWRKAVGSNH